MITQYEVSSLLREELPYIEDKIYPVNIMVDVYKSVHYFTDYTRKAILYRHLMVVKKCFRLADQLYHYGDNVVKMCIENIFIYSFTSFMPADRIEKLILQSFIPPTLNSVYLKQISSCGC
jgi:hypothetical protein